MASPKLCVPLNARRAAGPPPAHKDCKRARGCVLCGAESLRDRRGAADMEPALVCAAETVELHCWAGEAHARAHARSREGTGVPPPFPFSD
eukprot:6193530-Pleurochrysis_carterae.AAC.2